MDQKNKNQYHHTNKFIDSEVENIFSGNYDQTILSYYEDEHYYDAHSDQSIMTSLTFCIALSRKIISPTPKSIENKPIILYSKNTEEITITIQSNKFSAP